MCCIAGEPYQTQAWTANNADKDSGPVVGSTQHFKLEGSYDMAYQRDAFLNDPEEGPGLDEGQARNTGKDYNKDHHKSYEHCGPIKGR
jgi:hypothetical protein